VYRFIWILVAKNASSTLRQEFERDQYRTDFELHENLAPQIKRDYFTFVFLRDPVYRALSAYQEVSYRADLNKEYLSNSAFVGMPEGLERFESFLDEVRQKPWDGHVLPQARFVDDARIDYWGSVDNLQNDIEMIFRHLGIRDIPNLPRHRSRSERASAGRYKMHFIRPNEITPDLVSKIRRIYHEDEELYNRVIKNRQPSSLIERPPAK